MIIINPLYVITENTIILYDIYECEFKFLSNRNSITFKKLKFDAEIL